MKHVTRIGVLRGGPSTEYEVSLNTGAHVLSLLRKHYELTYHPKDIFIDTQGIWHTDGVVIQPSDLYSKVDVVFNALHGNYGEDGKVQHLLHSHGIPFTGSDALSSAVGMNKILTKKILSQHKIKSPYWKEVSSSDVKKDADKVARTLFTTVILPTIIKPSSSGSSVGVTIVRSFEEFVPALISAAEHGDLILVEEFIPGIEASCGVVENFRNQKLYALPPIEIRPHSGFFDYQAKYGGNSHEIVPATFSASIKKNIEEIAVAIHLALGLKHYSRSDFIIHPRRGVYTLEVNTLPGLTSESLLSKSLRAVGSDTHELIDHVIKLAMKKKG